MNVSCLHGLMECGFDLHVPRFNIQELIQLGVLKLILN